MCEHNIENEQGKYWRRNIFGGHYVESIWKIQNRRKVTSSRENAKQGNGEGEKETNVYQGSTRKQAETSDAAILLPLY